MYWLVWQTVIEKEHFDTTSLSKHVSVFTCIRKVLADTKEEAIGKFFVDTQELTFIRRVDPIDCIEFDKLKTI